MSLILGFAIIIRSVENNTFPDDPNNPGKMSNWFKGEFWDFYDNGLELIAMVGRVIFDEEGYWDILDWQGDQREANPKYKVVSFSNFYRIPDNYIVELYMETDPYYALPALDVEYKKDGMPDDEIFSGIAGSFKTKQFTYYFDNSLRAKLQ